MSEAKPQYKIAGKPATIFRVVKSKENPYVMIDRRPIDNPKLSFKAKGILTYLLSRPDGWEVSVADLIKRGTDGEAAIRSGLKELKNAGHMKYSTSRIKGRITGWLIEVYEVPDGDFQQVEIQDVENQRQVVLKPLNNKTKKIKEAPKAKTPPPEEVLLFRQVTERYPPKINFQDVVDSISKMRERLQRGITVEDLKPFYASWCHKGYKPVNLSWLEWAETGEIPKNGNWKPRDMIQERYGGIMEWAKEMQNEYNTTGDGSNYGKIGGGVPKLEAG